MKELIAIQGELKAPKDQYNDFGKYKYRSAESILSSVKPLLKEHGCTLTLSDKIVEVGGRVYVEATAELRKGDEVVQTTAYAREPETKKGMDTSQITGTASSYARKYALNGLFAIDDTKDADTNEYRKQTDSSIPDGGTDYLINLINEAHKKNKTITKKYVLDWYGIKNLDDMTKEQYLECVDNLNGVLKE